jgi:hypothetical protein
LHVVPTLSSIFFLGRETIFDATPYRIIRLLQSKEKCAKCREERRESSEQRAASREHIVEGHMRIAKSQQTLRYVTFYKGVRRVLKGCYKGVMGLSES